MNAEIGNILSLLREFIFQTNLHSILIMVCSVKYNVYILKFHLSNSSATSLYVSVDTNTKPLKGIIRQKGTTFLIYWGFFRSFIFQDYGVSAL